VQTNPYAPPSAPPLKDLGEASEVPRQLIVALVSLAAMFLIGALHLLSILGYRGGHWRIAAIIAIGRGCVGALWIYGLYRRQNWLRWLTTIASLVSVAALPWALPRLSGNGRIITIVEITLMLATAILLSVGRTRRWFTERP
jgi:hypothetical protein